MTSHAPIAWYDGYCAQCSTDMPLVLVEHGPRGLRAWLSGVGHEDRTLSYCCRVCGRDEHVPATEAEDADYDLTLRRWPDTFLPVPAPEVIVLPEPVVARRPSVDLRRLMDELALEAAEADFVDLPAPALVAGARARAAAVAAPRAVVHVLPLPTQRVSATDLPLVAST